VRKEIITTRDGSHTVAIPELNATYHSIHGVIQESMHVFIKAGLQYVSGRFNVKKLPGPPGKREMLQAEKATG